MPTVGQARRQVMSVCVGISGACLWLWLCLSLCDSQVELLRGRLAEAYEGLEIRSVDGFQARPIVSY